MWCLLLHYYFLKKLPENAPEIFQTPYFAKTTFFSNCQCQSFSYLQSWQLFTREYIKQRSTFRNFFLTFEIFFTKAHQGILTFFELFFQSKKGPFENFELTLPFSACCFSHFLRQHEIFVKFFCAKKAEKKSKIYTFLQNFSKTIFIVKWKYQKIFDRRKYQYKNKLKQ